MEYTGQSVIMLLPPSPNWSGKEMDIRPNSPPSHLAATVVCCIGGSICSFIVLGCVLKKGKEKDKLDYATSNFGVVTQVQNKVSFSEFLQICTVKRASDFVFVSIHHSTPFQLSMRRM